MWATLSDGSVTATGAPYHHPLCCARHLTQFAYNIVFMPLNNHIRKALSIWFYRRRKQDRELKNTVEEHTIVKFLIQIYLLLPMLCYHPYMPMYMCFCQSHICPNFHCMCNKMETNILTEILDEVGHREGTRQESDLWRRIPQEKHLEWRLGYIPQEAGCAREC